MEERLSVEILQPLHGMAFSEPCKRGVEITGQHVYGMAFSRKMMMPEVAVLGSESGSLGYEDDDFGFVDKRMI